MIGMNDETPSSPIEASDQPLAVPRKTVSRFVKALLLEQRPQITHPDGRPLYGYRVQGERYDDLRARVQFEFRELLRHPVDEHLAAGFVLYAAETWRRAEDLTRWNKWDVVLETLGHSEVSGPELYEAVRTGLQWWHRPLVRLGDATRYLATLVCEGGLPLYLVHERGSPFRRYFRELIAHVRDFGLQQRSLLVIAERESDNLPRTLRHQHVHELGARLVEQLWRIHMLLKDRDGDPIHALDALDPTWRDQLPLRIDDEMARRLLRELIDDVREVVAHRGAEPRVRRWLELHTTGWVLHARVDTPRATTVGRFAGLFGDGAEAVPRSFRLAVQTPSSSHPPFATGYRHGDTVQFEVASARRAEVDVFEGAGQVDLVLDALTANAGGRKSAPVAGSQPLSDEQPWVFRLPDEETGQAILLADGGCRTQHAAVLVAVPDGITAEPTPSSTWTQQGRLHGSNRLLCECRGEARLCGPDGDEWRIATAQEQDEHFECLLSGERFPQSMAGRVETFVGLPRVLQRNDSGVLGLPASHQIDWRPAGRRGPWRTDLREVLRHCELRVRIDHETRLVRRIAVLPASFTCCLDPIDAQHGRIRLSGIRGAAVAVATAESVVTELHAETGSDDAELVCRAAQSPGVLRLKLQWPDASDVDLVLPAPFRSAHFVTASGTKCHRDFVALDEMFAMRAVVVTPHPHEKFKLTGRLRSRRGIGGASLAEANRKMHVELDLRPNGNGVHAGELRHLVDAVRRALRVVDDLDLQVELTFEVHRGSQLPRVSLSVQRYASTLHCEYEGGWVSIGATSDPITAQIEHMGVRAFRLHEPKIPDLELERLPTPSPTWLFDPENRSAGPWMLYGHIAGVACTRPRLWMVGTAESLTPSNAHARAVVAPPDQASEPLSALHAKLVTGADPAAWEDLEALLRRCVDLPASSFTTVAKLVSCPPALLLCLLRASTRETFDSVFQLRDELPFDWSILPLSSWLAAWSEMLRQTRERYATKLTPDEVTELVQAKCDKIQSFLPQSDRALRLLAEWVRARNEMSGQALPAVHAAAATAGQTMIRDRVATLWMELRRRHAEDEWPRMSGIETWAGNLTVALESACGGRRDSPERVAIARAPWVAAGTALASSPPDAMLVFELERARAFDAEWFDLAHEMYLAVAIAHFEQMEKESRSR